MVNRERDKVMKNKLLIAVLLCFGFAGGFLLAKMYPFRFSRPNDLSRQQSDEINKKIGTLFSELSLEESMVLLSQRDVEQLKKDIFFLLSQTSTSSSDNKIVFYRMSAIERLVKEFPVAAMELFEEPLFLNSRKEIQAFYAGTAFSSLAKYHPDLFIQYYPELLKKSLKKGITGFVLHADISFHGFMGTLLKENPSLAYQMLTDGSLDEIIKLREKIASVQGGFVAFKKQMDTYRLTAASKMGVSEGEFWTAELDKSKNKEEREGKIALMIKQFSEGNPMDAISWAKTNLKENDQKVFFKKLLKQMSGSDQPWQVMWNVAVASGLNTLSSQDLSPIFQQAAKQDAVSAINVIDVTLKGKKREDALAALLSGFNEIKTPQEMLPMIERLQDGSCKDQVLPEFFKKYYASSPDEALAWAKEKNDIGLLSRAVDMEMKKDSNSGIALAASVLSSENNTVFDEIIVRQFLNGRRTEGLKLIENLNGDAKKSFMSEFYSFWAETDTENAIRTLENEQYSPEEKTYAKRKMVQDVATVYPPTSLVKVLSELKDPDLTKYAAEQYVWAFDNREGYNGNEIQELLNRDIPGDLRQAVTEAWNRKQSGEEASSEIGPPKWRITTNW